MDIYFVVGAIIVCLLLLALILYAMKKMASDKKYAGAGFGEPVNPRELTEKEKTLYQKFSKKIYGKLYAAPCSLAENYGSDEKVLTKRIIISFFTSQSGIYGYPCAFEISGKEYALPRGYFYYLQDQRLQTGSPCTAIWEEIEGKWHFRCAIPNVYLQ